MASLLAIEIIAVRRPSALGSKVTWNVRLPPAATELAGCVTTVKSAAFAPLIWTTGVPLRFKAALPVLRIVKLLTTVPPLVSVEPKSVPSVALGVVSPSTIDTPPPCTSTSGAGAAGVVPEAKLLRAESPPAFVATMQ